MNQLKQGIKIEMEHKGLARQIERYEHKYNKLPTDRAIAKIIAREHLQEDKQYYTKLKKAKL